jgi:hypothetical protein
MKLKIYLSVFNLFFSFVLKNSKKINNSFKWGLGIGDWGLGPIPNPQSPIPNPQSPFKAIIYFFLIF